MTSPDRLRFTLLGTGSSGGVPRVGNDWGVCDPNEPRNRRRRCSALLDVLAAAQPDLVTRILIDTSPDLREQLLAARVNRLDAVVFTHDHADQTHGIDDIRALAITMRRQLRAYLDADTQSTLIPKFRYCFEGSGGYPPILERQPLIEAFTTFEIDGPGGSCALLPLDQEHGRIRSLGFRISGLAYCNDLNGLPERSLDNLQGLDVLVIDALRYTPHPSHANLEQTLAWIDQLKPRRAVLTNLHVDMDFETLRRDLPNGVEPGFDGMEIELDYAS